ncbi:MAG: hypothetical protein AB1Z98_01275, partial [Nannocystaceae bacterium]
MTRFPISVLAAVAAVVAVPALAHCGKAKTPEASEAPRKDGEASVSADVPASSTQVACDDDHQSEIQRELYEMCRFPFYAPLAQVPIAPWPHEVTASGGTIVIVANPDGIRLVSIFDLDREWGEGNAPGISKAPLLPYGDFEEKLESMIPGLLVQERPDHTIVSELDAIDWSLHMDRAVATDRALAILHALHDAGLNRGRIVV